MQQYISNLWMALTGNNPYQAELDDLREKYEKTAENVGTLRDQYLCALEKYDEISKHVNVLIGRNTELAEQSRAKEQSLQTLVENLRERIADKERELEQQGADFRERMERMKADYQRRIDEYTREIDRLKNTKNK